jgi:hypothetical protein
LAFFSLSAWSLAAFACTVLMAIADAAAEICPSLAAWRSNRRRRSISCCSSRSPVEPGHHLGDLGQRVLGDVRGGVRRLGLLLLLLPRRHEHLQGLRARLRRLHRLGHVVLLVLGDGLRRHDGGVGGAAGLLEEAALPRLRLRRALALETHLPPQVRHRAARGAHLRHHQRRHRLGAAELFQRVADGAERRRRVASASVASVASVGRGRDAAAASTDRRTVLLVGVADLVVVDVLDRSRGGGSWSDGGVVVRGDFEGGSQIAERGGWGSFRSGA